MKKILNLERILEAYWFIGSYDGYLYVVYYYDDSYSGLFLKTIASVINSKLVSKIVIHLIMSNLDIIPTILTCNHRLWSKSMDQIHYSAKAYLTQLKNHISQYFIDTDLYEY